MTTELFLALSLFALVMSGTPGPNNLMVLTSGVNFGFRRTLPHMLGISFGFAVMLFLIGLGVGQVFDRVPALQTVLKILSIAYMLWLAWRIATAGPLKGSAGGTAAGRPMSFIEGALFQWVNPKAWAICLTGVAAYTVASSFYASLAVMVAVFTLVNVPVVAAWTLFGVALRPLLADPARVRVFNFTMAALLVASLAPIVLDLAG